MKILETNKSSENAKQFSQCKQLIKIADHKKKSAPVKSRDYY